MRSLVSRSLRLIAFGHISAVSKALNVPNNNLVRISRPCCASFLSSLSAAPQKQDSIISEESERPVDLPLHVLDSNTKKILVVGDGDLSYSASISSSLAKAGSTLVASVLENEEAHQRIYKNSKRHSETIASANPLHQILFETDATILEKTFPPNSFDTIQFNFPHWRGKANNRYNRQLLGEFLASASRVLKRDGEIQVALRREQGGARAETPTEWKLSWQAAELSAMTGLLLSRLDPFEAGGYDVSSYRGNDRGFQIGTQPERYIFTFPNGQVAKRELQLCFRHELRLYLDPERLAACAHSEEELMDDGNVLDIAREVAPEGVRAEIAMKARVDPVVGKHAHVPLLVFLMVYSGESSPLTRTEADKIRERLEKVVKERIGLEVAKKGRLVSKAFPFPVLERLISDYTT